MNNRTAIQKISQIVREEGLTIPEMIEVIQILKDCLMEAEFKYVQQSGNLQPTVLHGAGMDLTHAEINLNRIKEKSEQVETDEYPLMGTHSIWPDPKGKK